MMTFNKCVLPVLTYGAEALTLTTARKLKVIQRKMERSMLDVTEEKHKELTSTKENWRRRFISVVTKLK